MQENGLNGLIGMPICASEMSFSVLFLTRGEMVETKDVRDSTLRSSDEFFEV